MTRGHWLYLFGMRLARSVAPSPPCFPCPPCPADACQLTALTSLELSDAFWDPQLLHKLAQRLPHLQRLVLSDVPAEQCEQLPRLAALSALTSLSLATSPDTGLPQPELLQLLAPGRLRCLELKADYSYDCHLPLTRLSGLQSLALDTAEIQVKAGGEAGRG